MNRYFLIFGSVIIVAYAVGSCYSYRPVRLASRFVISSNQMPDSSYSSDKDKSGTDIILPKEGNKIGKGLKQDRLKHGVKLYAKRYFAHWRMG